MKFLASIIVVLIGLVANALGTLSPIDGYEIVNVTWTVQPKVPGVVSLNLTGTVQDVWDYISTTWPGYPLPRMDWPQPPPEHNLTDGYIKCGVFEDADRQYIKEGVAYLNQVPGKPGMPPGPGSCGRVSCSEQSAIYWCNDNDHSFWIDSFSKIADAAHDIWLNCVPGATSWPPSNKYVWTSGQIFFPSKWNVIVRGNEDYC